MVYQVLTITIAAGKDAAAKEWLKKMIQYQKEHYGIEIQIVEPLAGSLNRYMWIEKYASFAEWEQQDTEFWSDPGAMAILKDAEGVFAGVDSAFYRDVNLFA